ncbi:MAG TPA: hypothetical protein VKH37_02785, partial [Ferruginibacter sp.]|nr:hypothetical protein [Ferruginibacter sp.]
MPVDKTFTDAMLGTFRTMLQDCKDKDLGGSSLDTMQEKMDRMEALAIEMDDAGAYSAKIMTEGLFNDFSTAYGQLMAEEGQKKYGATATYDDDKLLQQTLSAYENSLAQLDDHPDKEKLQAPINAVIEIGRSGVNYPTFLRLMLEKGLDKAMEGSTISRDALNKDIHWSVELMLPEYERRNRAMLAKYDEMSAAAAFGVPDSVAFSMQRFKIESEFQPAINKYQAIVDRWGRLLSLLHDWIDAYTSFAPYDDRYVSLNGMEATRRNIKFHKECDPGFFQVREDIFNRYFSMKWEDIFEHESFAWERKAKRCMYTDEYV